MKHSWLGLIELLVVLMFAAGWAVLELVVRRLDRRKAQAAPAGEASEGDPRHAEGQ
jgi:hypothetical protein